MDALWSFVAAHPFSNTTHSAGKDGKLTCVQIFPQPSFSVYLCLGLRGKPTLIDVYSSGCQDPALSLHASGLSYQAYVNWGQTTGPVYSSRKADIC